MGASSNKYDFVNKSSLAYRQEIWPEWKLPLSLKNMNLKNDLFYPNWFEGVWSVEVLDNNDKTRSIVVHDARFLDDHNGHIIADRAFNAKSLGNKIFGDRLIDIIDDHSSPNRQLALFDNDDYLESKVIRRSQDNSTKSQFVGDELFLQVFHGSLRTTITYVEVLSKYKLCSDFNDQKFNHQGLSICGEQLEAVYSQPGISSQSDPIRTSHYRIILHKSLPKI